MRQSAKIQNIAFWFWFHPPTYFLSNTGSCGNKSSGEFMRSFSKFWVTPSHSLPDGTYSPSIHFWVQTPMQHVRKSPKGKCLEGILVDQTTWTIERSSGPTLNSPQMTNLWVKPPSGRSLYLGSRSFGCDSCLCRRWGSEWFRIFCRQTGTVLVLLQMKPQAPGTVEKMLIQLKCDGLLKVLAVWIKEASVAVFWPICDYRSLKDLTFPFQFWLSW